MSDYNIEKATIKEAAALSKIATSTFVETYASVNTEGDMKNYLSHNFSLDKLTQQLQNPNIEFHIATQQNENIGYLQLNFNGAQTELKQADTVEIERIYTSKHYYGKGLGPLLCAKAIEVAKQRKALYLWLGVWERNPRAIRFYEKNGFVEFDRHIFMLGADKQVDIMMRLDLS